VPDQEEIKDTNEAPPQEAPAAATEATDGSADGSAEVTALRAERDAVVAERDALKAERDDLKDQLLRKVADFDNYRKRMLKEKDEARQFANSALLEDLCQVLDDFERAIKSSEGAKDFDALHNGILMIEGQFASMLERKYNLKRLESLGKPFSPDHHEAIAMDPAEEGKETVVVEEYQKGYQLHDRVLRTAKVKVGHAKTKQETKEGE
jgi:molecular chaperone GrpE